MTAKPIVAESLTKTYPGGVQALRGLSFSVEWGEIFALIGPNGAGKTTTLRILSTLILPSGGSARILDHDVVAEPMKVREVIGYLPEEAGAYPRLTGIEFLRFVAAVRGKGEEAVEVGVQLSGLGDRLRERIKGYSKGMVRRLLLASVLMTDPKVAILDEPTSGMDVLHSTYIRRMIKEWVQDGERAVLLSSHNMLEVEYLSDRVLIISGGVSLLEGEPREIMERFNAPNLEEVFVEVVKGAH